MGVMWNALSRKVEEAQYGNFGAWVALMTVILGMIILAITITIALTINYYG